MSEAFFTSTRGCVYVVRGPNGGGGKGFYSLRGAETGADFGGEGSFIVGGDLSVGDIVTPVTTLDRTKILYSFGVDWGRTDISGNILLGEGGGQGGKGLADVIKFFNENRSSAKNTPCQFSVPGNGKAFKVFLHRLTIGLADPQFHIQPFVFSTVVDES